MSTINPLSKFLLLFLYPILLLVSAHFGNRNDISIILVVSIVLPLYFYFLSDLVFLFGKRFYLFFLYCFFLRVVVVGSQAVWSDDIYRYLFDAKLFLNGISPYHLTPAELVGLVKSQIIGLEFLVSKMNSPSYYSVYPLLLQCFFSLGTLFGLVLGNSFLGVQVLLLTLEVLNLFLIRKLYPNSKNSSYWLYFGNPIVILEGVSQMHPEVLLVTGFLCLFLARSTNSRFFSFFLLTQLKFNTFLFTLGLRWNQGRWRLLFPIIIVSLIIWKLTVFSDFLSQSSAGIGLFFHSFRFAGILEPIFYSILYAFEGEYLSGFVSFLSLGLLLLLNKRFHFFFSLTLSNRFFILYSLFLLFSPVVHPWYWIPWFLFMIEKRNEEVLVSFVSFIAFLSYSLYVDLNFMYIHWMISILVLGYYGNKQINYLRKTT